MIRFYKKATNLAKFHALKAFEINRVLELRVEVHAQHPIMDHTENLVEVLHNLVAIILGSRKLLEDLDGKFNNQFLSYVDLIGVR